MKVFPFLLFIFLSSAIYSQTPQLWGTASTGGTNGIGTIMKINGDGTGFQRVFSFTNGSQQSTLLPAGTILYGNTVSGGVGAALGSIFSYNSSNGDFNILFSFDSASGYYPRTTPIFASNGKLYGNTNNGGAYDDGTLFSFDLTNNSFQKLLDFNDTVNGKYPVGELFQASNGKLYGMTSSGGSLSGGGVIYSFTISTNTFTVAHEFNFTDGFTSLGGSFIESNGLLYGMTFGGGSLGFGVIFSFNLSNDSLVVVHNFNGAEGAAPTSTLLKASNGLFYGTTSQGGVNNDGIIFSFNPANNAFILLHDFADSTGNKPNGGLMQASDGNLYGMTQWGGANNFGVIFSYNIGSGTYSKLHDCNITNGALPYGNLIEFNATTGTHEVGTDNSFVTVFPNPANKNISVRLNNIAHNARLQLTNIVGRQLENIMLNSPVTQLRLDYPPGIYFITITDDEKRITKKLVVE